MRFILLQSLFASAVLAYAVPASRQTPELDIVKTVTLDDGQVLDWVRRDSQDVFVPVPEETWDLRRSEKLEKLVSPIPEHLRGPEGTVPIPRRGLAPFPTKQMPPSKESGDAKTEFKAFSAKQNYAGTHWYSLATVQVKTTGAGGAFSMFKPFLESNQDFSLLQTAVMRYQAKTGDYGTIPQTLETGWLYYPPRGNKPMFFTFFTANGYQSMGDNLCAWNTEYKGWVQVDTSVYPGMMFDKMSVVGGEQHDFDAKFHLKDGKWWLKAFGRDIGYYPADLFSKNSNPSDTLAESGDRVDFYGEVYNSGYDKTSTDMGSGNFPDAGDGKVGYIRNMVFLDAQGKEQIYNGYTTDTDGSMYKIRPFWNSASTWKSYIYVGGPGANGVVGG